MDFNLFKSAVSTQFAKLQQHKLFRVDVSKDTLWETYLSSFPEGTNLVYRERREYDCSCCRQFIRTVGDVVAIIDGALVSIWDVGLSSEPAFQTVADTLSTLVKFNPILEPFLHYERHAGTDRNFEQLIADPLSENPNPPVKTWTHFHVNINSTFVREKSSIPSILSDSRSTHDVFLRSLREISIAAINTVLDLIAQNSLYRGEEHESTLRLFLSLKTQFDTLPVADQDLFAWDRMSTNGPVSRIRSTAIGTLLVALSNGEDLESSVRSFESIVAPANYRRPTSLITPAMIDKAKQTLTDLGLISSLDRRFAIPTDIGVNNALFTDRSSKSPALADAFDDLKLSSSSSQNFSKVEEITIDKFISDVLPRIDSLEILFENHHANNLVSIIASSDPTAPSLFKWNNSFSWSYKGEFADAIRERVKRAGGNVTGDLCCRLAWYNYDDLDLHMVEPRGGEHIYYGCRKSLRTGGMLDVDMNVSPTTREPVENIFYPDRSHLLEGVYHLYVHQFNSRESTNPGFDVEIDYLGQVYRFSYQRPVRARDSITVAKFSYSHKEGFKLIESESLLASTSTRELWNIHTNTFHRVNLLTLSPNYWTDESKPATSHSIGNKHYFFMINNCINDGSARGFYNEFLKEKLNPHRKVFEVLASKMKPESTQTQLSGLGFSSTRNDSVICRVKGSFTRTVKIIF